MMNEQYVPITQRGEDKQQTKINYSKKFFETDIKLGAHI